MNRKDTKALKEKLVNDQTGKSYRNLPTVPANAGFDKATPGKDKTVMVVVHDKTQTIAEHNYDQRRTPVFKSETGMPGFKSFSNTRKWRYKISTIIAILICVSSLAQYHNPCAKRLSIVGNLSGGGNRNGFTTGMELGVWGVDQPIGATVGFLVKNDFVQQQTLDKTTFISKEPTIDLIFRLTAKVAQSYDDQFYHVLTAYALLKGDFGGSYRLYKKLSDYTLLGVEPVYSYRYGVGANAVLTFVLN